MTCAGTWAPIVTARMTDTSRRSPSAVMLRASRVRASVISGRVLCVIGVLACGLGLPRFVRYDARQSAPAITGRH